MEKRDIGIVGRCDGTGALHDLGSYFKLAIEGIPTFCISEGAAENLRDDLDGFLGRTDHERAATVAYLRERADEWSAEGAAEHSKYLRNIADCIGRGDHLRSNKEVPNGEA
jgi:hypothetical protein